MFGNMDKWIEIDAEILKKNLKSVKNRLKPETKLIAVLKADAYGQGAVEAARVFSAQGVDYFAVAFLHEALELRMNGISDSIIIFTPLSNREQVEEAADHDFIITLDSYANYQLLQKLNLRGGKLRVHLKIDTGLGRFGFQPEEILEVAPVLKNNSDIYVEGIYTHMASAGNKNPSYTEKQFNKFIKTINNLEAMGFTFKMKHCANSAVFLKYPHMHLDAVRLGTLLSGQYPVGDFSRDLDIADPYKFKTRVISVRTVKKGEYLGYYGTYRAQKWAQIAVIPVGFNDGLGVEVANRPINFIDLVKKIIKMVLAYYNVPKFMLQVRIKGQEYPVRGKIFMQMALIEVPLEADIKVGDEVEVPVIKTLADSRIAKKYVFAAKSVKWKTGV